MCRAMFVNFGILSLIDFQMAKIKQNKLGCKTVHVAQPCNWETQCLYTLYARKKVGHGVDSGIILSDLCSFLYFPAVFFI